MKKMIMTLCMAACFAGCATHSPDKSIPEIRDTDPMIVQLSETARQAFEAGEVATAMVMYQRALERARAMDNSREIARNAYNLAACHVQLEDWDAAMKLLTEAGREAVRAGEDSGPVLLLAAETARRAGEARQAEALLDRLEANPVSDSIRGQAYVMRAHLACDRNDVRRAEGHLNRARGHLRKAQDPGLAGAIAEVGGRIAELSGKWIEAGALFDREAAFMQQAGRLPEMAHALDRAGQNYVKAQRVDESADRFFRSSRSWMAQGNYIEALRVIEQAAQMSPEESNDSEVMAVIAGLFEEIRASIESQSQAGVQPAISTGD